MAAASVDIDCPECHDTVAVPLRMSTDGEATATGSRLVIRIEPDVSKMAEHYALEHA